MSRHSASWRCSTSSPWTCGWRSDSRRRRWAATRTSRLWSGRRMSASSSCRSSWSGASSSSQHSLRGPSPSSLPTPRTTRKTQWCTTFSTWPGGFARTRGRFAGSCGVRQRWIRSFSSMHSSLRSSRRGLSWCLMTSRRRRFGALGRLWRRTRARRSISRTFLFAKRRLRSRSECLPRISLLSRGIERRRSRRATPKSQLSKQKRRSFNR
mmetsp:Transcript_18770/g.36522  ORF Transcript_18770/g.36522 Transcript_18770/m.36522 type:complete len:210 (+) Transcript_18770:43-672(+)